MKRRAVAPGDWAGADEWVSSSAVSGISPAVLNVSEEETKRGGVSNRRVPSFSPGPGRLLSASVSGAMTRP